VNDRQAFDLIKSHLLKQNKRSVRENGRCCYRGPGDLKCAIGCLIPDALYEKDMDENASTSIGTLLSSRLSIKEHFKGVNHDLLTRLQMCHDNIAPEDWPTHLDRIEREHFS
jgi:hypothetical protein